MRDNVTRRQIGMLVCALLLGAAIALPVGMMLGGAGTGELRTPIPPPSAEAPARNAYSPKVLGDPYFLDEQRKGAEALEAHCLDTGEMCAEARAARRWVEEHGG